MKQYYYHCKCLFLILMLFSLHGCGGGGSSGTQVSAITPAQLAKSADGLTTIAIAAGAVPANTTLTVASTALTVAGQASQVYDIGPTGTVFNSPATVTIAYNANNVPANFAEAKLILGKLLGSGLVKKLSNIQIDTVNKTISGQTGSLSNFVVYADTVVPIVVAPANVIATYTAALSPVSLGIATASDNIDGVLTPQANNTGPFPFGTTTVTWQAVDNAGNIATATQLVTINDTTPPIVSAPASMTVMAIDAYGTPSSHPAIASFLAQASALDLYDGALIVSNNALAVLPLGQNTITFTAVDKSGNKSSATSTILIVDQTPPSIVVPADITLATANLNPVVSSDPYVQNFLTAVTANDNVDGIVQSITNNAPNSFPLGATTVTFTAVDAAGNTASSSAIVTVQNVIAPTVTAPANIVVAAVDAYGTAKSNAFITSFLAKASAVDNKGGKLTVTNNAPAMFALGTTTVIFSATDSYGNTGQSTANVSIQDQTPPTITIAADVYAEATGVMTALTIVKPSTVDNVDTTLSAIASNTGPFSLGSTIITWSATDTAGNTTSATQQVIINDTTAPTITSPAGITIAATDQYGTANTAASITAFLAAVTANDLVDGVITNITNNAPTIFPMGMTTVTFTATDSYANTATGTSTVTIVDQTPPVVTAPANSILAAIDAYGMPATNPSIIAFLNGATSIDNVDGVIATSNNALVTFPLGTTNVTFSATDAYGNTATAVASVTIKDQTTPTITAPASTTVAALDAYGTIATDPYIASFLAAAQAVDNVSVNMVVSNDAPAVFPIGTTMVTFTAQDAAGNIGSAIATLTVADVLPPQVIAPADIYTEATAQLSVVNLGVATASDNVDGTVVASVSNLGPYVVGTTAVTWTATDAAGNKASAIQYVIVNDTLAPVITPPQAITVAATDRYGTLNTDPSVAAFLNTTTATDIVDGTVIVANNAPQVLPIGTTAVIFNAVDTKGNASNVAASITVVDQTAPTITPPSNLVVAAVDAYGTPATDVYITAFLGAATASDNVDGTLLNITNNAPTRFPMGNTIVAFSASDQAGNTATIHATVTVRNRAIPLITPPADITVGAVDSYGTAVTDPYIAAFLVAATAIDSLGANLPTSNNALPVLPLGVNTITFTATDALGVTGTATAIITIIDQTAPIITVPAAKTIEATAVSTPMVLGAVTAIDNVNGIINAVVNKTGPFPLGITSIVWTATDTAGNTSTATQVITITDTTAPVITVPANIDMYATGILSRVNTGSATAIEVFNYTMSNNAPAVFPVGLTTVVWTATDANGNISTANQMVNIKTPLPPTITFTSPKTGDFLLFSKPKIKLTLAKAATPASLILTINGIAKPNIACQFDTQNTGSCTLVTPLPQGANTITATVKDVFATIGQGQTTFTVNSVPLTIGINAPIAATITKANSVFVSGVVGVDVYSVSVNGIAATLNATAYTVTVPLREGKNTLVAVATALNGRTGTNTVDIVRDIVAPIVSINSPRDGFISYNNTIAVTGIVNDTVDGGIAATVLVNGTAATVSKSSFLIVNVPLVAGDNIIEAVATDSMGNSNRHSIHVRYQATAAAKVSMLSGNGQGATINTDAPKPLIAIVKDHAGNPLAGRKLTFKISRNSGKLKATATATPARLIHVVTDSYGKASALLTLGDTAGIGNNRVIVSGAGIAGEVEFCADSNPLTANRVVMVMGDNQRGVVGYPLTHPLEAMVIDQYGNPVAGVAVTYTITTGNGNLNGGLSLIKTSDIDGRVRAILTLGQDGGINNNVVSASFAGLQGSPATFVASGLIAGNAINTALSGVVMDDAHSPIPGATVSLKGTKVSSVLTNPEGYFLLTGVPTGQVHLMIDPTNSARPEIFPRLAFETVTIAGQNNNIGQPILIPELDPANAKMVGGAQDVVLTMKGVEGLSLKIFANSVTCLDGTKECMVSINPIHMDKVPMAPPNGINFMPPAWTVQPAGTLFNPPAQVTIPNNGLAPGKVIDVFQFDHILNEFINVGKATVSEDGATATSDPGFGISRAGWGGGGPPPPPPTCASSCDDKNLCTKDSCNTSTGQCEHTANLAANGSRCDDKLGCSIAFCNSGKCTISTKTADNSACDDGKFCTAFGNSITGPIVSTGPDKCWKGKCEGTTLAGVEATTSDSYNYQGLLSLINGSLGAVSKVGCSIQPANVTGKIALKVFKKCCEVDKRFKNGTSVSGSVSVTFPSLKCSVPALSFNLLGLVKVGAFGTIDASGSISASGTSVLCTGEKCGKSIEGSLAITLGVGLEAAAGVSPDYISVSVSGSAGGSISVADKCGVKSAEACAGPIVLKGTVTLAGFYDKSVSFPIPNSRLCYP